MMRKLLLTAALVLPTASFAAGSVDIPTRDWDFERIQSDWDKDRILRGYTVATQVCLACHGLKYISHRDLMRADFTENEAKKLAADLGVKLDDKLLSQMDDQTSVEIYGKVAPDLSVMNKARAGGANYVWALLHGYTEGDKIPEKYKKYFPDGMPTGSYFNKYFGGHAIAMPNPITGPELVEYHDGTEASVDNMIEDVAYFMQFTAEPELKDRQRLGVYVLLYLFIFTILAYFVKRHIWRDVKK